MLNEWVKSGFIIIIQFISGSIMYSYYLAKLSGVELNDIGDGNPGVSNLWKAAGWKYGITGIVLDYFKGILPLLIFILTGFIANRYVISVAALAGVAGHAFSPFLKFRGGKGITTTFGAWTMMTKWEGPLILGGILGTLYLIARGRKKILTAGQDAMIVLFALAGLLLYTLFNVLRGNYPLIILYLGNLLIIFYRHSRELSGIFNKAD